MSIKPVINVSKIVNNKLYHNIIIKNIELLKKAIPPTPRTKSHLAALRKAESRGKTPAKLSNFIKPMVLDKDDPQFIAKWNSAIIESERSLMRTLQSHLTRVVDKTTHKVHTTAKQTMRKIKQIHNSTTAKNLVEQTVTEAD